MKLSRQQQTAVNRLNDFLKGDAQVFGFHGYAGTGKAQPFGSIVQTPDGPRNIEDLRIGDRVFTARGTVTRVTGVFPQGVQDTYRVTFRDGFSVDCNLDHLWKVQTRKMKQTSGRYYTLTTREILDRGLYYGSGDMRWTIPLTDPVQYPEQNLPVDPYVLGTLLGDGTNLYKTPILCSPEKDRFIIEEVQRRVPSWVRIHNSPQELCNYFAMSDTRGLVNESNGLAVSLKSLGVAVKSPERFIPDSYLRGSIQQRWDLLRGLMDTDGSTRNNRTSFSSKSEKLARGVAELTQSLGGVAVIKVNDRNEYHVNVKTFENPFLLPRKADRWSPSKKNPPSRYIRSIEKVGSGEHVCIMVEDSEHLYLTDHYVVTHNSTVIAHVLGDVEGVRYAAPTAKATTVLQDKGIKDAVTLHSLLYQPYEYEHPVTKKPTLGFKENPKSELWKGGIIVVDESSMVSAQVAEDLLKYPVKVIAVGDPGQLPPVMSRGDESLLSGRPDVVLTEVHRTALDSPILELATHVREKGRLPHWRYEKPGGRIVQHSSEAGDLTRYDQIIVGRHKTRVQATDYIRRKRGYTEPMPYVGEQVICKKNDREKGLINGQQYVVKSNIPMDDDTLLIQLEGPGGWNVDCTAWTHGFLGLKGKEHLEMMPMKDRSVNVELWHSECITAHSSQGSEWNDVCVVDESRVFGRNAGRWLYTALTRAKESVVVVRR